MALPKRFVAPRLSLLRSASSRPSRSFTAAARLAKDDPWAQKTPLGAYYESIIQEPTPYPFEEKPEIPADSADPEVQPPEKKPSPAPTTRGTKKKPGRKPSATTSSASHLAPDASQPAPTPPSTAAEKARIVFGSSLAGPAEQAERVAAKRSQSTYIAGVLVPPRPEEPDNCCMSGCVNCVWDRYRDEVEEWSAKKSEAQARLAERGGTVDADGGGSESNWGVRLGDAKIAKDLWDEDVFEGVPVGIREFMKQEKRLRDKHKGQGV
ncbi:hypothetical protein HIM_01923 [Hirsutella minnesotensis 3608]|nr:hypothetical protein HIM_01923 [Hirsutella minnesotensis 3608]